MHRADAIRAIYGYKTHGFLKMMPWCFCDLRILFKLSFVFFSYSQCSEEEEVAINIHSMVLKAIVAWKPPRA